MAAAVDPRRRALLKRAGATFRAPVDSLLVMGAEMCAVLRELGQGPPLLPSHNLGHVIACICLRLVWSFVSRGQSPQQRFRCATGL